MNTADTLAHTFDNVLTCLLGYLAMAQEQAAAQGDTRIAPHLERAGEQAWRAAALVRQLRSQGGLKRASPAGPCGPGGKRPKACAGAPPA